MGWSLNRKRLPTAGNYQTLKKTLYLDGFEIWISAVYLSKYHYVCHLAQLLLSTWLKARNSRKATIGELWVNCYIQHRPELQSKYTHQYDHQHAKCENPKLIEGWFICVHETIQKYGNAEKDIYNMDETGFQMGVASTAKVICGSKTRESHAKSFQPGNHEWITAIIAISASGSILPLSGSDHSCDLIM